MAAYWFEVKRDAAPVSVWAPPGAPYLLNINHPRMRDEFERAKLAFGVPTIYPMSDIQRMVWEVDMIIRFRTQLEEMPSHVRFRLKTPPYDAICKRWAKKGIKKDR